MTPPPLRGLGDKQNFKNTVFSFFKYFIITCTQNSCDKTEKMVLIKKKFQDMLYIYILSEKVDFLGRRGVEPPPPLIENMFPKKSRVFFTPFLKKLTIVLLASKRWILLGLSGSGYERRKSYVDLVTSSSPDSSHLLSIQSAKCLVKNIND